MKIYSVNVYIVDQNRQLGSLKYLDRIIVKRTFFKVKEIITGQPVCVVKRDNDIKNVNIRYYNKYDFILAIKKESLNKKNMVNYHILDIYFSNFIYSPFIKFIDSDYTLTKSFMEKKKKKYMNISR